MLLSQTPIIVEYNGPVIGPLTCTFRNRTWPFKPHPHYADRRVETFDTAEAAKAFLQQYDPEHKGLFAIAEDLVHADVLRLLQQAIGEAPIILDLQARVATLERQTEARRVKTEK